MLNRTRRAQHLAEAVAATTLLFSACVGTIDEPRSWDSAGPNGVISPTGAAPGSTGVNGQPGLGVPGSLPGAVGNPLAGGPNGAPSAATCGVGLSPLRRLTHAEYDNSVRDLLGDTTHPSRNFALDTQVGLFDNSAEAQTVPALLADEYLQAATDMAGGITDAKALLGCDPKATGTAGTTCVQNFVTRFGRKFYRRPLTPDEQTRLSGVYTTARTAVDELTGVQAVVAALLVSPNFLFRPEFGTDASSFAGAKRLSSFETAARLSSLLWAAGPDDTLLEAASSGQLATSTQVATQARRMLADEKAKTAITAFYDQWLGLSMLDSATKDPAVYPSYNDELKASMVEEQRRFVSNVLWQDDARLETLLTAPYSMVNAPLAAIYGVPGPADAATFAKVQLDPSQRAGVMTQTAMLTGFARPDESSPVKRGKWVRVRMLCQDLPDPPANIPQLPAPEAGVSNRERFAMHTNNAACSGCHHLIDGLGFGLEHYDSIGAWRTVDQGTPVDSSGEINSTVDIDGTYNGGPELASLLARSAQVRDCAPTQWLRYAWGRRETADDTCSVATVRKAFADSDGNLRELMVALTQTDTFMNYRQAD